jgi:protein TonB
MSAVPSDDPVLGPAWDPGDGGFRWTLVVSVLLHLIFLAVAVAIYPALNARQTAPPEIYAVRLIPLTPPKPVAPPQPALPRGRPDRPPQPLPRLEPAGPKTPATLPDRGPEAPEVRPEPSARPAESAAAEPPPAQAAPGPASSSAASGPSSSRGASGTALSRAAPGPASSRQSPFYRLNEVDRAPEKLSLGPPVYPHLARKNGVTGRVLLRLLVDEQGRVIEAEVVEATPRGVFEENTLKAARQWRFKPGRHQNRAVITEVLLPVEFTL